MERQFDNLVENIFDRMKAKAAGAVGGAKAAASAIGKAATGQSTAGVKQAFDQGRKTSQETSLVSNKVAKMSKSVDVLTTDLYKLTGLEKQDFDKQYPDAVKFIENILANIETLKAVAAKTQQPATPEPAANVAPVTA